MSMYSSKDQFFKIVPISSILDTKNNVSTGRSNILWNLPLFAHKKSFNLVYLTCVFAGFHLKVLKSNEIDSNEKPKWLLLEVRRLRLRHAMNCEVRMCARPRARGASEERGTPAPRLRASARVPRQQPRNSKQSVLVTCTIIYCIFTGVMLMISKAH